MTTHRIELPPKLVKVFAKPSRYKGSKGGRGSGKTRSFAKMTAVFGCQRASEGRSGVLLCGREFQNSLADSSFTEVRLAIQSDPWLVTQYEIGREYIRHVSGKVEYAFTGLRHNIESLKGKARILLAWIDEAEQVSEASWQTLIPTVREDGSEIWLTWNPKRKGSATDLRFVQNATPDMRIVEMNWRDNPWFPEVLNEERLRDKDARPEEYEHVWEGAYRTVTKGAYFAPQILAMKAEGRLTRVSPDPLMTIRLIADIGGTGAKADNFVFWAMQYVGREIRVLNHYEVQGQPIAHHLQWLRSQGYGPEAAQIWLPHDGDNHDKVYDVSYRSAFEDAGYTVTVVPNQGRGAAMMRVEAARRCFPMVWMDEDKCAGGLEAVASYHAKIDETRGIDLGPDHDWSSHSADAYGLGMVVYEEPQIQKRRKERATVSSWMG